MVALINHWELVSFVSRTFEPCVAKRISYRQRLIISNLTTKEIEKDKTVAYQIGYYTAR